MDVDFSMGEIQSMQLGDACYTEAATMIEKLSAVVQSQTGMFEFRLQPVNVVQRERPLQTNPLVMSLVCHVDEQLARRQASDSIFHWYVLETPQPDIWIEPELHGFFLAAHPYLAKGIHLEDLAERLEMKAAVVHENLTNLRLLGLIKLIDGAETVSLNVGNVQEQVSRKSNEFLRASRAVGEINRMTGSLPVIKKMEA
jgi:hypothetical protein